ncbi:MAG: hypothetical protein H0X69_08445 [Gemmatimonadales bacterium]|nr:hypothetical protein [Gemmatimonadales bacterium]
MPPRSRRSQGRIEQIPPGPDAPGLDRALTIYLPPPYGRSDRRYPVLYMQDGQNLFDPEASFAGSWWAYPTEGRGASPRTALSTIRRGAPAAAAIT